MTSCHFRHVLPFVFTTCHVFYPGLTPHPTIINVFFFVEVADFDVTVSNNLGSKQEEDLDDAEVDDKSATWSGLLMFFVGWHRKGKESYTFVRLRNGQESLLLHWVSND